jgi:cytochrome c oxidase subunit 2
MISALISTTLAQSTERSFWMPAEASEFAGDMDFVFYFITGLSVFFFVAIVAVMAFFIIRYRRRSHIANVPSITHNTPLELTWTIVPLILVIAIFYVGMKGYVKLRTPPIGAYTINVTGAKWQWTFSYPDNEGISDTELFVPLGQPVRLVMKSDDVLHSMFIPVFRVKQDVVPGRYTDLWFTPTTPGVYDVYCAEYCGTGHSTMTTRVHVLDDADFAAKMNEIRQRFEKAPDEALPWMAFSFLYSRCASCHSVDGGAGIGPSWRGLWTRIESGAVAFTDGTQLSDQMGPGKMFATPEDYIYRSILYPQEKIEAPFPGSMPSFKGQLRERQIEALVQLIKGLDANVDETGAWVGPVPEQEQPEGTASE